MKNSLKRNDTDLRVLEILKALISSSLSSNQLLKIIESNDCVENIYAKETLLKYFNTLELWGIKVAKEKKTGNYYLAKLPVEVNLTEKEVRTLCYVEYFVSRLGQNSFEERYNKICSEIQRCFSRESIELYKKIKQENLTIDVDNFYNRELLADCEKYCIEGQKLKIAYMSRTRRETEIFYAEPKEVIYQDNTVYFMVYNPKTLQNQKLIIDNILRIEQLPQKAINFSLLNNIVFELKAPLSKSYRIKSGEKIINYGENSITVVNTSEDKDILLNRLLRYGQNCKIVQPQSFKNEFCRLLNIISSNLKANTSEVLEKYGIEDLK